MAAVRQLAEHYRRSPDRITEEELRHYFLYLANEKKVARATATITLCGIRFFYQQTLHCPWTTLRFVRPPREKKLPVVLSRDEVRTILAEVRIPVYPACQTTIYGCGLRLLEGTQLEVPDVDSARMLLFIHAASDIGFYVNHTTRCLSHRSSIKLAHSFLPFLSSVVGCAARSHEQVHEMHPTIP